MGKFFGSIFTAIGKLLIIVSFLWGMMAAIVTMTEKQHNHPTYAVVLAFIFTVVVPFALGIALTRFGNYLAATPEEMPGDPPREPLEEEEEVRPAVADEKVVDVPQERPAFRRPHAPANPAPANAPVERPIRLKAAAAAQAKLWNHPDTSMGVDELHDPED